MPFVALALSVGVSVASPAYLRFPDLHGDTVVFNTAGDLWTADIRTGKVERLTSHPGDERYPHFSPDGKQIAFTGAYEGNYDVYVVATEGGEPRRLTWHNAMDEVVGWTPEGRILFRTRGLHPLGATELYTLPAQGGEPEPVPLGWAARLAQDPSTGLWAFNRIAHERATWKRYRGGMNSNLWVGDPARQDYRQITEFSGMDDFPMWWDGRLFFLSDRGGTYDLWSVTASGQDPQRHTNSGDLDVRYPNQAEDGRITYTRAGDIWIFDPRSNAEKKLDLDVPVERNLARTRYPYALSALTWFNLSPDGDRLAVVTRGEVFSVPTDDGVTLPVTRGTGARESWASFSPDGKRLAYVTDAPGEQAIMVIDAWGRGEPSTVKPAGASGWNMPMVWSPDGARVAWADQTNTLYIASVPAATPSGGKGKAAIPTPSVTAVDRSEQWEITEYSWSPDGRWLAYTRMDRRDFRSIYLYDTQSRTSTRLGEGTTDDYSPAWDPEGRYLYFLSDRHVNPLLGGRDFQVIFGAPSKLCAALLRPDVKNPLLPSVGVPEAEAPVVQEKRERKRRRERDEGAAEPSLKPVGVELEHLADRVIELPVPAGYYGGLSATSSRVFFQSGRATGMNEDEGGAESPPALMSFDWDEKEASVFLAGVLAFDLASKGEKMAVLTGAGQISVIGTGGPPGPEAVSDGAVDLSEVVVELNPRDEWRQIYQEGWRLMRDFYWDADMAGVDWVSVRDRYAALLPRLSTREELRDLMGEVIGELATSHTYLWGGDDQMGVPAVSTGLLGVEVKRVGDAYQVLKIYHGDPADNVRSPLMEPGAEVKEGEYILAVNNQPLTGQEPFLANFEALGGNAILLTVNSKPTLEGARAVIVRTLSDDHALRYADWVRTNREYVAEKSGGKLGYLHIPNMGAAGLTTFLTWYFPQVDKEGLVVDVRWNGGGFVSQLILERLRRPVTGFDHARGGGVWTYPAAALNGPFVVITNEFAGSDGDIFPRAVQLEGLAPVIGMRSWGGVVGIRADKLLQDNGMITQPEFANWYPKEGWGVENHGVDPDIEVQNRPQDLVAGKDPQLDRAIEETLRLRAERPPIHPEFGPAPSKSRDAYRDEPIPPPK